MIPSHSKLTEVLQVVQQRNAQAEVEDSRRQIQDLGQIRKQLQRELADVKDRLEAELAAKNEEASGSLFPHLCLIRVPNE